MEKSKEIRKFLTGLTDVEFRYLRIQISLANDARNMIDEFKLSRERFCELMQLKPSQYNQYIKGGFDYTIKHMALLQAAYFTLKSEQAEKEAEHKFTEIAK